MIKILYEDDAVLVAVKPAGLESQASRKLEPDMVSEIKNYLLRSRRRKERQEGRGLSTKMSTNSSTQAQEPYVGVIHRLDKPVSGVMVYAKTKEAAAFLSKEVQAHRVTKIYHAVICGKPVDNVGNFVDKLSMNRENNYSRIVDNSDPEGKTAELSYRVIGENKEKGLTLVEIHLKTGRPTTRFGYSLQATACLCGEMQNTIRPFPWKGGRALWPWRRSACPLPTL